MGHSVSGVFASQAHTPNKFIPLGVHLDPSDKATIIASGSKVSQKSDKSKNGNHVTQFTGNRQPTTGTDTINGKNVIKYFNLAGQFLNGTPALTAIPLSDHTIFFICKMPASTPPGQALLAWNDATTLDGGQVNREVFFIFGDGRLVLLGTIVAIGGTLVPTDLRDQTLIITIVVDHGTDLKTYINGILITTIPINPLVETVDLFTIGSEIDLGISYGNFFNGSFGEIIINQRILTDEELVTQHNYLSNKWGIPLA